MPFTSEVDWAIATLAIKTVARAAINSLFITSSPLSDKAARHCATCLDIRSESRIGDTRHELFCDTCYQSLTQWPVSTNGAGDDPVFAGPSSIEMASFDTRDNKFCDVSVIWKVL